jgi:hypothetical protein
MTITSALLLITVGAILRWAVTAESTWIDLQEAGLILFVIGIIGFVIAVVYTFWWPPSTRSASSATSASTTRS